MIGESSATPHQEGTKTILEGNETKNPGDNIEMDPPVIGIEELSKPKEVEVIKENKEMEDYPFRQESEELIRSSMIEVQERNPQKEMFQEGEIVEPSLTPPPFGTPPSAWIVGGQRKGN